MFLLCTSQEVLTLEAETDLLDLINGLATGDLSIDDGFESRRLNHFNITFSNITFQAACGNESTFFCYLICITRLCKAQYLGRERRHCVLYGVIQFSFMLHYNFFPDDIILIFFSLISVVPLPYRRSLRSLAIVGMDRQVIML